MRFNAHLDMSHHGLPRPFRDSWEVGDSLTGIHNATVRCYFAVSRSCMLNPEDSDLATVKAMQWVLLYLSVGRDRCY
jgi:hypothetical protein